MFSTVKVLTKLFFFENLKGKVLLILTGYFSFGQLDLPCDNTTKNVSSVPMN